jgi:pyruvate/2-oxoglutarate dehydrogenase complex dihydrolipoamide acyltransferase (E2) component
MIRHTKTAMKATAVLGIPSQPESTAQSKPESPEPAPVSVPASTPPVPAPQTTPPRAPTSRAPTPAATSEASPLVGMVHDVVLGMILNVPAMRTKLQCILDNPSLMTAEIKKAHDELQTKLTPTELRQLNAYACQDSSRRTIGTVMQTAFANIMADGKIDMNDAPHFLTLIHDCITLFSENAAAGAAVALNSNTVITFLHFVLKCILILTLDGAEEDSALVMLDGSFKLVKLTVLPLLVGKKWCCFK